MIRAKFRCMSITYNADQPTEVRFLPVAPKCSSYPEGCEENKAFWDASPSGEMKAGIPKGANVPFIVGDFYYIDMEPSDEGWKLWAVTQYEHNINISMGLGWDSDRDGFFHAELDLGITNKAVWPTFTGKSGSKWAVTITPAS